MRLRRRSGCLLLVGALALATISALLLWRDLPRRTVASHLGQALSAPVQLERLVPLALDRWRLEGLSIERPPAWPWLARIEIDRLEITGDLGDLLDGKYRDAAARGVTAWTQRPTAPALVLPRQPLTVDELTVDSARLMAPAGDRSIAITVRVQDFGRAMSGSLDLESEAFAPASWLRLLSSLPADTNPLGLAAATVTCPAAPAAAHIIMVSDQAGGIEAQAEATLPYVGATTAALSAGQRSHGDVSPTFSVAMRGIELRCWTTAEGLLPAEAAVDEGLLDLHIHRREANGPILLTGEAQGLVLTFEQDATRAAARGDLTLEATQETDGSVHAGATIRIRDAAGRFGEQSGRLVGDLAVEGRRDADRGPITFAVIGSLTRLEALGHAGGDWSAEVPALNLDIVLETADDGWSARTIGAATLVPVAGRVLDRGLEALGPVRLTVDGDLRRTVAGSADTAPVLTATGQVRLRSDDGEALLDGSLTQTRTGRRFDGRVDAGMASWGRLHFDGPLFEAAGGWHADGRWRYRDVPVARLWRLAAAKRPDSFPDLTVEALAASASGHIRGELTAPQIEAELELEGVAVAGPEGAWHLTTDRARISIASAGRSRWRIESAPVPLTLEAAGGAPVALRAAAAATILTRSSGRQPSDRPADMIQALEGSLDAGHLGRLTVEQTARGVFELAIEGASVPAWTDHLASFGIGLVPAEFSATGIIEGTSSLRADGAGTWSAEGLLQLVSAGFSRDDGSRVAEGLGVDLELQLAGRQGGALELDGRGSIQGPLVLWQTAFGDYSTTVLDLRLRGGVTAADPAADRRFELESQVEPAGDSGEARLEARVEGRFVDGSPVEITVRGALETESLGAAYDRLVAEPFAGSPWLHGLSVAGAGRIDLDAWDPVNRHIRGSASLDNVDFATGGETLQVEGLDLDLPIDLAWPNDRGPAAGARLHGSLGFRRLIAAGLPFSPAAGRLAIEADTVRLDEPLTSAVAGGSITLDGLAVGPLLSPDRQLTTGLTLRGLALARITSALDLPSFEGSLDGEVPLVRLGAERFRVEGDATLRTLGGTVRLFDIAGRELFSRFPRVTFSADLERIDLEGLTSAFSFGRMSGLIDGEVRRCTLVKAQLVACSASVQSTEGLRYPRWIDVEAVNNISLLGTGGGLERGLARRFLSRFTYDKLGVSVQLADDRFLLRGLVGRRDKELFLKGRLPFSIDVVNADPGAAVSFQIMLDRLRGFDQAHIESGRSARAPSSENQP